MEGIKPLLIIIIIIIISTTVYLSVEWLYLAWNETDFICIRFYCSVTVSSEIAVQ